MFNLGVNYGRKGKLDDALIVYKDCYERSCVVLGRDHSETLIRAERVDCINKLIVNPITY